MNQSGKRRVVLVSGAPGSGKTTLAEPLAAVLGFPLLAKDHIKESLFDALGSPFVDLSVSRKLGGAAMELMWALAARCPAVVLEANFRPRSKRERTRIHSLGAQVVEVYCRCSAEEALQRFQERSVSPLRHLIHLPTVMNSEVLSEFATPLGIGEVIEVDTTSPVDIPALAAQILTCFSTSV